MNRHELRHFLVNGPIRPLASFVYGVAINLELAVARMLPVSIDHSLDEQVTVLIKTFERPAILRRLVASIRRGYPSIPVIVVDDSREPTRLPDVETIVLPYDSGVSAGRQAGLDHVQTPFVLVVDDDYVFLPTTTLAPAVEKLVRNTLIDILGGMRIDLPLFRCWKLPDGRKFKTPQPLVPIGSTIDDLLVCDFIANFYIARTERLRLVGWDEQIRRLDHSDFFRRALGVLVTVYSPELRVLHAQTPFDAAYMTHRMNFAQDLAILKARWSKRHENQ